MVFFLLSKTVLVTPPAVHMIAHLLNVEWYNNSRQGVYDDLSTALSNLTDDPQLNTTYLNPIRTTDLVSLQTISGDNNLQYFTNGSHRQVWALLVRS